MSLVKLLLGMNLSPDWVPFFTAVGIDSIHWSSIGSATASDAEIMNWARERDFIVFTNDLDFSALLAMTRDRGPSVLQVRLQDLLPDAIGEVVVQVLRTHDDPIAKGAIITIAENATRVRVLPLRAESA